jgi:hypothetical protein
LGFQAVVPHLYHGPQATTVVLTEDFALDLLDGEVTMRCICRGDDFDVGVDGDRGEDGGGPVLALGIGKDDELALFAGGEGGRFGEGGLVAARAVAKFQLLNEGLQLIAVAGGIQRGDDAVGRGDGGDFQRVELFEDCRSLITVESLPVEPGHAWGQVIDDDHAAAAAGFRRGFTAQKWLGKEHDGCGENQ